MEFEPIEDCRTSSEELARLLRNHPKVKGVDWGTEALAFSRGGNTRAIQIGNANSELAGLVELVDNNPMVCSSSFSVPDAASTLALIAVAPLVLGDLILESPALLYNFEPNEGVLGQFLALAGYSDGLVIHHEEVGLGNVGHLTAMVEIPNLENFDLIDELYQEKFGRAFYVREAKGEWDTRLVKDTPFACYRLRLSPGEFRSLLTIQVMADRAGKLGSSQVIHAMNVMAGFEETLGIPENLVVG